MKKRFLSIIIIFVLCLNMVPAGAVVADDTKLCSHHPEHTADCGYVEAIAGTPCTHEHTEECYQLVTQCIHEHTEECYVSESENETTGSDEEQVTVPDEEQGTASDTGETAEPDVEQEAAPDGDQAEAQLACTHECSEESGCVIKILDCQHEHDDSCGYSEGVTGLPCNYECKVCLVQDLIDALPKKITKENKEDVIAQMDFIMEKYQELTEEEQQEIDFSRFEKLRTMLGEEFEAPYYLFIVHSMDLDGDPYAATELVELEQDDFQDGELDLKQYAIEKEGMETVKTSYYDPETYSLEESKTQTISLSDFMEGGDPEDGSNYYAAQVLYEYGVADGYRAIVPDNPSPAEDPYGIMMMISASFTGSDINVLEFERANIVTITVNYMYSPTGGLSGMPAAAPKQYQILLDAEAKEGVSETFDIPYAHNGTYQNLDGFRIVLDPEPLNAFLVDEKLANEMTAEPDPKQVKYALENDLFTIIPDKVYRGGSEETEYNNAYSQLYNEEWNKAREFIKKDGDGNELYTAIAKSADNKDNIIENKVGADPLSNPKLIVTIPQDRVQQILKEIKTADTEYYTSLEKNLTVTVYYRRNAGAYTVNHWVPNLGGKYDPPANIGSEEQTTTRNNQTYYNVYQETKQGRIGAITNAISGMDQMDRAENWTGFDFTPYVTEGFAQQVVQPDGATEINIYYKPASEYRIIFDTDDTYIPRVQADLNDTLNFNYTDGKLSISKPGGDTDSEGTASANSDTNSYKNPTRTGYEFECWRYEVNANNREEAEGLGAYEDGGKYYINIADSDSNSDSNSTTGSFTIDEKRINDAVIVLANDADSTVKAIHLYPKWKEATASVRVVFWTEDLSGGTDDVKVVVENSAGNYEESVKGYKNTDPTHVPDDANFSNAGSFTFTATTGSQLDLSVDSINNQFATLDEGGSFEVSDANTHDVTGNLAQIIDAMFQVCMPPVTTSYSDVDSWKLYHPYQVEKKESAEYKVAADGSTVINVYYARNVYTVDFTYYGQYNNNICVTYNRTYGFAGATNPRNPENFSYEGATFDNKSNTYGRVSDISQLNVPEKITITAKYGADLSKVWPKANSEDNSVTINATPSTARFISWTTTIGAYNDQYRTDTKEPTLMGIYSAMSADIIADPSNPAITHHMYAYWSNLVLSYYRFNHCYEVPDLTENDLKGFTGYDITDNAFGSSTHANADTSVDDSEKTRRNLIYLVPTNSNLNDYFKDYIDDLMEVNNKGEETSGGGYYAVRIYKGDDENESKVYALAKQVLVPSSNVIEAQNPSARVNLKRVNSSADHDTRASKTDGKYGSSTAIGSTESPYDLFFYYDRDRFQITYMTPARASSTGEYILGTKEVPFGASLKTYKVDLVDEDKKLYSDNEKFVKTNNYWTAYDQNTQIIADDTVQSGYARVVPNAAKDGKGTWQFDHWALDRSNNSTEVDWENDTVSGNLRVYAIWEEPTYQVTFQMEGGVLPESDNSDDIGKELATTADRTYKVNANQGYTSSGKSIPRPTRNGYILSGWKWYTIDSNGEEVEVKDFTFETPITQDMVAKADWSTYNAKSYSYKIWYLTNDDFADGRRKTGTPDWLSINDKGGIFDISEENGTWQDMEDVPEGLDNYQDYRYVLGCQYVKGQQYPEGTSLLLPAESFSLKDSDGKTYQYIPYNGNATIQLNTPNAGADVDTPATAETTEYVAYFYYTRAQMKKYEIEFVPYDWQNGTTNPLASITQSGETDKAYFAPSAESLQALKEAGYQLVKNVDKDGKIVDAKGDAIDNPKTSDLQAAKNISDLQDFIQEQNQKLNDSKSYDQKTTVTFKVMPIPYKITYGVANPSALGTAYDQLLAASEASALGNRIDYDVTYFNSGEKIYLNDPTYVQIEDEWWKFTGWSRGDDTRETTNTQATVDLDGEQVSAQADGDSTKYTSLAIDYAVGDLEFLANWETVDTELIVTNTVKKADEALAYVDGYKDYAFEYQISIDDFDVSTLLAYRTSPDGKETKEPLQADGKFTLKAGESMSFGDFTGTYHVTQTIDTKEFNPQNPQYFELTNLTGSDTTIINKELGTAQGTITSTNVTDPAQVITFTNTYKATVELDTDPNTAGNQGFPVTKYLLENDERRGFFGGNDYIFTIRAGAQSDDRDLLPTSTEVTLHSEKDVQSLTGNFDSVRFEKPGTYTYVISEERPKGAGVPGVSYDPMMYRITVEVSVDEDNPTTLKADIDKVQWRTTADESNGSDSGWGTVSGGVGSIIFENTYNTTQVSRTFMPTKELKGRNTPLEEGEFYFILNPVGSVVMDPGNATTYHNATDDESKLKILNGLGTFTADSAQPMPENIPTDYKVTNGESGAILINGITFTSADMGGNAYGKVYKYTLQEYIPPEAINNVHQGVTYDTTTKTLYVYVHLHKTSGGLAVLGEQDTLVYADVFGDRNATFTNTYEATPLQVDLGSDGSDSTSGAKINVEKQISGREFQAGDSFTFDLQPKDGAPMPKNADSETINQVTITPESGNSANVPFGNITFEEAGTYEYTLWEVPGTAEGMTYDTTQKTLTITVTDNNEGQLSATATVTDSATAPDAGDGALAEVVFHNTYTATVDLDIDPATPGNQGFPVTKYLLEDGERRGFFGGNDYIFTIREGAQSDDGTPMPASTEIKLHSSPGVQSLVGNFGSMKFTKEGTYTYVISEERPIGEGVPGVSYDPRMYRITVKVTKNEAASRLEYEISSVQTRTTADTSGGSDAGWTTVQGGSSGLNGSVIFENTYNTTEVNRTFQPLKVLEGRSKNLEAGEFTFTLNPVGSVAMTEADAKAYHEAADNDAKLAFLMGLDNFTVDSAQPMPENIEPGNKVTNGESGAILIGDITYTSADMGGNAYGKVYKYTLKEDIPADAVNGKYQGVVYDEETRTLYVYVHLHKTDGTLAVLNDHDTLVYADVLGDRSATFTNTYEPTPISVNFDNDSDSDFAATISIEKQISGREFQAGDSFTFNLQAEDGTPMPKNAAGGTVNQVTIMPESGNSANIPFGYITFDQAGTYKYTLEEVPGDAEGMTYDTDPKTLTITVMDNNEGQLTAVATAGTVTEAGDAIAKVVFNNTYIEGVNLDTDPETEGSQGFPVTKYLLGENGERRGFFGGNDYTFTIRAGAQSAQDTPLPASTEVTLHSEKDAQSLADYFGTVRFTKPGKYIYIISEERPEGAGVPGVSYDPRLYRITVDVTGHADDSKLEYKISSVQTRTAEDLSEGEDAGWITLQDGNTALKDSITFENTYNTTEVNRTFQPTKELTGRDTPLEAGEFTFTLNPAGSVVMDLENARAYHIAADNDAKLALLKEFDNFTEDSAQPMPGNVASDHKVANGESGAILIGDITYTSADMGGNAYGKVYKYTLEEDIPEEAVNGKYQGMIYDTETRTLYVYVHLHHANGTMAALGDSNTLVYADVLGDRNATFTNTYETISTNVDFGGTDSGSGTMVNMEKQISGRSFQSGDSFTFTLEAEAGTPMPKDADGLDINQVTITPDSGESANVSFGNITFEKAGTYQYTLREQAGNAKGMTYDTEPKTLTITVTDEGGQLVAAADSTSVKWTNTYKDPAANPDPGTNPDPGSKPDPSDPDPSNPDPGSNKDPGSNPDPGSNINNGSGSDVGTASGSDANISNSGKLPQTGMLWWPVWMLAIIGAFMLGVGIVQKKTSRGN